MKNLEDMTPQERVRHDTMQMYGWVRNDIIILIVCIAGVSAFFLYLNMRYSASLWASFGILFLPAMMLWVKIKALHRLTKARKELGI